ncbi:MAG: hypothetical protein WBB39_04820 [Candidatus Saccharimonadales bacterium]
MDQNPLENQQQQVTTSEQTPLSTGTKPARNKTLIYITIIAILLISSLMAWLVFGHNKSPNNNESSSNKSSHSTLSPSATPETNPTQASVVMTNICVTKSEAESEGFNIDFDARGTIGSTTIFFKPDSSEYIDEFSAPGLASAIYTPIANFYKSHAAKAFTINITPMTNQASQDAAGIKLAADRAEVAKRELIAQGVPSDRIIINTARYGLGVEETARNVIVEIVGKSDCIDS